jgi:hypothetical protein
MATCPRCIQSLDEGHRCSGRTLARKLSQEVWVVGAGIAIGAGTTLFVSGGSLAFMTVMSALATVVTRATLKELCLI